MSAMIPAGIPFGSFARRVVIVCAAVIAAMAWSASSFAQQAAAVTVGKDDIGGVVTSAKGSEAGVWVIAETTDLPTKFSRSVVTDDQGRYLVPDLPKASYSVWVRGYGLVDSAKVKGQPGKTLNLKAVVAPDAAAAAKYYPAIYWYSMLKIPDKSEFPGTGTGANGNGVGQELKQQGQWLDFVKTDGCITCHQLGNAATRTIPKALGHFDTSFDAWMRRTQSGQASGNMVNRLGQLGAQKAIGLLADWTDRIAKGELPFAQPERPQGIERNVVVSVYDWATPTTYMHDGISTDRRNPTVNAWGPIYGATELSADNEPVLDPVHYTRSHVTIPVADPKTPSSKEDPMFAASPYFGAKPIWDSQTVPHNPMFDEKGRVWFTSRSRPADNPAFCKEGSTLESAQVFPIKTSNRQLSMYDPATKKWTLVNTCFQTHHLQFDKNEVLWTSSGGNGEVVGWLDVKKFEETGDAEKSQGWTPLILDTNGNGKRDDYVGPKDAVDPTKDKRISAAFYGVSPSPVDGSVWGSVLGYPGGVARIVPGSDPAKTALAEWYEPPLVDPNDPKKGYKGYSPRGMDIDTNGVVWTPLASGQLASFDRRKCQGPLNGPKATGQQCPEGWTLYSFPGPQFKGLADAGSAEASYYTWVDQHNTSGLGKDTPLATGNLNDSVIALIDGKTINLRVPYPMGFFAKGLDGRIDDPQGGWKGRGLWAAFGNRTPFHVEGGKGNLPKVVHFQVRSNPLEH
jgi:hypothetical protein